MTRLTRLLTMAALVAVGQMPLGLAGAASNASEKIIDGSAYGFDDPVGVVASGTRVWVLNSSIGDKDGQSGSVTELSTADGSLVRVIKGRSFDFNGAIGIAVSAKDVWVADEGNNSVTEINAASGKLVRVLAGSNYAFDDVDAIASEGNHIWVASFLSSTLTEINASTGEKAREIVSDVSGPSEPLATNSDEILHPQSIASFGSHLWVRCGQSITELNVDTGALVRVLSHPSSAFTSSDAFALAAGKSRLWIDSGRSVSEFSTSTGTFLRRFRGSAYGFRDLDSMAVGDNRVWVGQGIFSKAGEVLALNGTTGALLAVFRGPHVDFSYPGSVALEGTRAWVADGYANRVIELSIK